MAQDDVDDCISALEEWYSMYTSLVERDIHTTLEALRLPPHDLEAVEDDTVQAMKDIMVVNGFCSTCQTMLDSWPESELKKIYDAEDGRAKEKEESSPEASTLSRSPSPDPSYWKQRSHGPIVELPCHESLIGRMAAFRNGCKFCTLILGSIEHQGRLESYTKIDRMLRKLSKSSHIYMATTSHWDGSPGLVPPSDAPEYGEFVAYNTVRISWPGRPCIKKQCDDLGRVVFHSFPVKSDFTSPFSLQNTKSSFVQLSCMELARYWTETCLKSHSRCRLDQRPQYPIRLLSIATDLTRLVSTTAWAERPPYATLSHCWGGLRFETLRLDNLDEMHKCIPRELFTKTFLDAIEITRAVGIKYLWIDSWCIIQDDHNDWETEAAKMASVYSGSSLNIAASSAKDGTEGCFPTPSNHSGGFQAEVCVNGRKETHQFVMPGLYDRFVRESHLASRAWVVQEKVLAPRTLHCGDRGMFWECRTTMASEGFPHGFNGSGARPYLSKESMLLRPDRLNSASWTSLVTWFSSCDLSYPEDKLVALAGVARLLRDKTQDQYFAGLWRKGLETNIRWKAWNPQSKPPYRAPSWSWAAVDGRIIFDLHMGSHGEGDSYTQIHSISVKNTGADICGAVAHGILTLDCRVIRRGTVCWRLPQPSSTGGKVVALYADLGHERVLFPFHLDSSEHEDDRLGQVIYYVLLHVKNTPHSHVGKDDFFEGTRELFGLVLEKGDGPEEEYKRIGYFEYSSCEECDRRENEYPVPFFSGFFETVTINDTEVSRIRIV